MSTLTVTLRQPAQLGDRPRDNFVLSTLEYLPGAVVRGAFAAAWIARHNAPEPGNPRRPEFIRLFEGGVRFGVLFPVGSEPASLAVIRHKYAWDASCEHVEYDRAVTDDDPPLQCRECKSPLEQDKGIRGGQLPPLKRRTSVAISQVGVALRGQLFTRETLAAGLDFTGTLIAADPADLDILAGLGPLRVGGRRTTHGRASIAIGDGAPPGPQRLDDTTLVLRLRSPGIFTDPSGRPRLTPHPDELTAALGVPARVASHWARWHETGGWHAASGLPKPAELTAAPGSAFLIHTERRVADDAITALAHRGLGLRRHEGFGDLAPPPVLEDGLKARRTAAAHHRSLMDTVAPLTGFRVRWPASWPPLRAALRGHVGGDPAATELLNRVGSGHPDAGVRVALHALLVMPHEDAAYVVRELGDHDD